MAHIEGEIVIERAVEDVFDFVADERNEPRYNPRMLRAEKLARTDRRGKPLPRRVLILSTTGGNERAHRIRATAAARLPNTDVRHERPRNAYFRPRSGRDAYALVRQDLEPRGLLRLISPIVTRIGRRQEEAIWAGLKRILEGG